MRLTSLVRPGQSVHQKIFNYAICTAECAMVTAGSGTIVSAPTAPGRLRPLALADCLLDIPTRYNGLSAYHRT
jgi:hypothetical protein